MTLVELQQESRILVELKPKEGVELVVTAVVMTGLLEAKGETVSHSELLDSFFLQQDFLQQDYL